MVGVWVCEYEGIQVEGRKREEWRKRRKKEAISEDGDVRKLGLKESGGEIAKLGLSADSGNPQPVTFQALQAYIGVLAIVYFTEYARIFPGDYIVQYTLSV
jgi:hypothetical protein